MAGEIIIVADDQPVRLQLTQAFLSNQGYKVKIASSGVEAAKLLHDVAPDVVFINLESADGKAFEVVRNLKRRGKAAKALALAAAAPGEEAEALAAGFDGSLVRPVQMSTLGACIRDMLERRRAAALAAEKAIKDAEKAAKEAQEAAKDAERASIEPASASAPPAPTVAPGMPATAVAPALQATPPAEQSAGSAAKDARREAAAAELDVLRARFLAEGGEKSRALIERLGDRFDIKDASKAVHQWIGTGGLLGFTTVSRLARDAENILAELPLDGAQLRETLDQLATAFSAPPEARKEPLPASIVEALKGKRVAAVEFTVQQQERLNSALERVNAQGIFLGAGDSSDGDGVQGADIVLIHVNAETAGTKWLDPSGTLAGRKPVILTGARDSLVALPQAVQALAREFLMDSWQPEEALVRLSLAAAHRPQGKPKASLSLQVRTHVAIADDDPAVLSLVRTALENFGMECHASTNGPDALASIRSLRPHAAVLDVNMPGMDGYEVLAAVRQEDLPVRVLLLTARQQESDVIRGFTLGADDYVVKPFSPMELVARLKRLLTR
jgi:DNA-binding response OmpR family regulator